MAKLFAGSLAFSMNDDNLFQIFTDRGYKPISARVIMDKFTGQSRGYGFVELGPGEDLALAIGEFDGLNIGGRTIHGQRGSSTRI
jgi:cold-inducible RNA-binding protein